VIKSSEDIEIEAADWLARLNADNRTEADERSFQTWLEENPAHAAAFEEATAIWDLAGGVPQEMLRDVRKKQRFAHRREVLAGLAVTVAAAGTFSFLGRAQAKVYETAVGERRQVTFEDNSVAMLDTDTRIVVKFSDKNRLVDLDRGRVNFHVAPDSARPFTVAGAQQTIVAHQSDFDVRRDGENISVVLISGQAAVNAGTHNAVLKSGERLVASGDETRLDRPSLQPLLAWQKGQAILENEKLTEAVAEMNRYSEVKLAIGDRAIEGLRVSGVYKVGDNLGFARSIARLLPLKIQQTGDRVILIMDTGRMRQG
jgi:transmembrane sensor